MNSENFEHFPDNSDIVWDGRTSFEISVESYNPRESIGKVSVMSTKELEKSQADFMINVQTKMEN